MAWDTAKPADNDLVRNFPALNRGDKTTLQTDLQVEHDVLPTSGSGTGRHKFQVANEASLASLASPYPIGAVAWALDKKRLRIKTATGPDTAEWLPFPSGTKIPFQQATAPSGWTRVVDAGNTDAVIVLRLNGEALGTGGTWTIGGLTHAHTHDQQGTFTSGGASATELTEAGGPQLLPTAVHTHNVTISGATADASTAAVSSDASWRPKFVDMIVASKD